MKKVKRDEWEIENDARTLARANEIMADKARYNDAVKAAKKMVAEESSYANAMKKVAGIKVSKNDVADSNSRINEAFQSSINTARR